MRRGRAAEARHPHDVEWIGGVRGGGAFSLAPRNAAAATRRQISYGTHRIVAFALVRDLLLCAKHLFFAALAVPMRATLALPLPVRAAARHGSRSCPMLVTMPGASVRVAGGAGVVGRGAGDRDGKGGDALDRRPKLAEALAKARKAKAPVVVATASVRESPGEELGSSEERRSPVAARATALAMSLATSGRWPERPVIIAKPQCRVMPAPPPGPPWPRRCNMGLVRLIGTSPLCRSMAPERRCHLRDHHRRGMPRLQPWHEGEMQ
jgi:hypothetical protein